MSPYIVYMSVLRCEKKTHTHKKKKEQLFIKIFQTTEKYICATFFSLVYRFLPSSTERNILIYKYIYLSIYER